MSRKSQVSLEFVFMIASLFMLFIIILISVSEKKEQNRIAEEFITARGDCIKASDAISFAASKGDGMEINITTYNNISIYNTSFITVTLPGKPYPSASCNFIGNLGNAVYYINGTGKIKNTGGAISIE